jgi:hypothetical protein
MLLIIKETIRYNRDTRSEKTCWIYGSWKNRSSLSHIGRTVENQKEKWRMMKIWMLSLLCRSDIGEQLCCLEKRKCLPEIIFTMRFKGYNRMQLIVSKIC